jgi:hypothetical protein
VFVRPKIDVGCAELIKRDGFTEPELRRSVPNSDIVTCYHIEYSELRPRSESRQLAAQAARYEASASSFSDPDAPLGVREIENPVLVPGPGTAVKRK